MSISKMLFETREELLRHLVIYDCTTFLKK
jgi:hypothetical protein